MCTIQISVNCTEHRTLCRLQISAHWSKQCIMQTWPSVNQPLSCRWSQWTSTPPRLRGSSQCQSTASLLGSSLRGELLTAGLQVLPVSESECQSAGCAVLIDGCVTSLNPHHCTVSCSPHSTPCHHFVKYLLQHTADKPAAQFLPCCCWGPSCLPAAV